jgi:excisionase family DNA binding protein
VTATEDAYAAGLADEIARRVLEGLAGQGDERPLLTIPDVAKRLAISPRAVYRLIEGAKLRAIQVEGRARIEPAEMDRYLAEQRGVVDSEGGEAA